MERERESRDLVKNSGNKSRLIIQHNSVVAGSSCRRRRRPVAFRLFIYFRGFFRSSLLLSRSADDIGWRGAAERTADALKRISIEFSSFVSNYNRAGEDWRSVTRMGTKPRNYDRFRLFIITSESIYKTRIFVCFFRFRRIVFRRTGRPERVAFQSHTSF